MPTIAKTNVVSNHDKDAIRSPKTSIYPPHKSIELQPDDKLPVIICPYVYDCDVQNMENLFKFKTHPNVPIYFWKDENLIGPERAYQHCWEQFPDRNIVILHTDMEPNDSENPLKWYYELFMWSHRLPNAGAIACNLLYPSKLIDNRPVVQCAGGFFSSNGDLSYINNVAYNEELKQLREVDWVTFGGIFLRRRSLDCVGGFDSRYEWAYCMDVDYCLEMRLRGYSLYHVNVELIHQESVTANRVKEERGDLKQKSHANFKKLLDKWRGSKNLQRLSSKNNS